MIVGSNTGEANRNTITIPKRTFLFNKFTTTGIVEQEQNGVINANEMAAMTPINVFLPDKYLLSFS